ncbi:MAG: PQQ-binding-like beta-propeller repeat protein [Aeromicrobium erythreum]
MSGPDGRRSPTPWFALGAGLVVAAWAVPLLPAYVAGLVVVACALASFLRRRRTARTAVVVALALVAAGLAAPLAAASLVTNRSTAWRDGDVRADRAVTVRGRTYLSGFDRFRVVDTATGRLRWSIEDVSTHVASDGAVVTADRVLLDRDGRRLWREPDLPDVGRGPFVLARDARTTVLALCDDPDAVAGTTCRFSGVDDSGTVRWRRTLERSVVPWATTADAVGGVLPRTVAVRLRDRGASRLVVLDVRTGRTVLRRDDLSELDGFGLLRPVGDRVLAAARVGDRCVLEATRGARTQWRRVLPGPCRRIVGAVDVLQLDERRLYVRTADRAVVTVRLADGRTRRLGTPQGEPADPSSWQLGPDVVLRTAGRTLVATDATTGRELWRRSGTFTPADVRVGPTLLLREPTRVPNPFLRPGVRLTGAVPRLDDWSRRLVLVDPRTGRATTSVVDPLAASPDLGTAPAGDGRVVVTHDVEGPAFLVAA